MSYVWRYVHSFACKIFNLILLIVVTALEWTKVVTDEFYAFLHEKLSDSMFHDNNAQWHALKEQIKWYEGNIENFIEKKKQKGKINQTMHKVMCPFLAMVFIHC